MKEKDDTKKEGWKNNSTKTEKSKEETTPSKDKKGK